MQFGDTHLGKMAALLARPDGALTIEDLNNHIWVAFQRALSRHVTPNWWEIRVAPADAEALGGTRKVAEACWQIVRQEWVEEGRVEDGETPDVVVCLADEAVGRGRAKVRLEELDRRALARKQITAEAAGHAVCAQEPSARPAATAATAAYALRCPWNGERIPTTSDLSLGRDATNDVVIADQPYVSHVHGQLVRDEASETGWSYLDLGSRNGSTINDRPVCGKTPLKVGDRIGLGGTCYVVFESNR